MGSSSIICAKKQIKMKEAAQMKNTSEKIEVRVIITAPKDKVWSHYTLPEHIMKWNRASDAWHTPHAENDLKAGGKFLYRMEAMDGSSGFDFSGRFDEIDPMNYMAYTLDDGRKVDVVFREGDDETEVIQTFAAEDSMSMEVQRRGWQAILDHFKAYTETHL